MHRLPCSGRGNLTRRFKPALALLLCLLLPGLAWADYRQDAQRLRQARQWEALGKLALREIERRPSRATAYADLGEASLRLSYWHDAILAYNQALRLDIQQPAYWYGLARAYHGQRDYPAAISAYQRVLRLNPRHADAWADQARAQQAQGDPIAARQSFRLALQLRPGAGDWASELQELERLHTATRP